MIAGLLELVKELTNEYKKGGIEVLINSPFLPQFQLLVEHLAKVTPKHVGIDTHNHNEYFPEKGNTYFNILEEADFCVGVFCLPKGSSLNLHDHPGMLVVSKFLTGSVHYRSMDLVDRENQVKLPKLLFQEDGQDVVGKKLEAIVKAEKIFTAGEINYLTPEKGNIHRFTALEDTALLDILLPNYNEDDHYCNYYIEEMELKMANAYMSLEDDKLEEKQKTNGEDDKEHTEMKEQKSSSDAKHSTMNAKLPRPGEMTTLIYSLPPLDQEIELVPYRGEKFDLNAKKTKEHCIKNTNK